MSKIISPKRLLVIPPRFIGDNVLAQALIASIREAYPLCQIHILVPTVLQNWFEHCPDVDEIHTLKSGFWSQFELIRRIQPDTVLMLRRSLSDALCSFLVGIKNRVGFSSQRLWGKYRHIGLFLTHASDYPALFSTEPHLKLLAVILRHFDIETLETPKVFTSHEDTRLVDFILEKFALQQHSIAAIHLASASKEKELPAEKFIPSIQYLHQAGFKIIAIGSDNERLFYHRLQQESNIEIINLCGETSLRVSALLLARCALLFSLDSGPVHMAAAAGCPNIVGIYGPTSETQWAPWPYAGNFTAIYNTHLHCRPCLPKICEHNLCREGLTDAWILQQLRIHVRHYMLPSPQ